MASGSLSDYFDAIAAKRLSAVETDPNRSNQHEFNGVNKLKEMFGTEKRKIPARFIYLKENVSDVAIDEEVTWYDARAENQSRSEY